MSEEHVMSLKAAADEAYEKAVAADWDGDPRAASLWQQYRNLKERLDKGELYEPKF